MINRKGDVPVVILVIGVLAVCILAIATFLMNFRSVNSSFEDIEKYYNSVSLFEQYNFFKDNGINVDNFNNYFKIISKDGRKGIYDFSEENVGFLWLDTRKTFESIIYLN